MLSNLVLFSLLAMSLGLLMVLLLSAAGVDFRSIFGIPKKIGSVGRRVDRNADAYALNATLLESLRLMRDALFLDGCDEMKVQIASLRETQAQRMEYLNILKRCAIASQGRHLMAAIVLANGASVVSEDEFIRLAEADLMKEAREQLVSHTCRTHWRYVEAVNALIDFQEAEARS